MLMKKDGVKEDILRQYIDTKDIRKAPEGFSSKVMSRIHMEARPVRSENKLIVPVISGTVFLVLTVTTLLVTERSINLPEIAWPVDFNFSFPDLSSKMKVPQITMYAIAGIVSLALLDLVLFSAFRREKK
jgi:hypothetical protein